MISKTILFTITILAFPIDSMDQTHTFNFKTFFEQPDYAGKTYLHRIIKVGTMKIENDRICRCHSSDLFDEIPDESYRTNIAQTHPTLVKAIIDAQTDLNKGDNKGRTPLYYAAKYKNEVATKLLLAAGANPNIKDKNGLSPLIVAASIEDNGMIIGELLNHGADITDLFTPTPDIFVKDHEHERTIETALKTCPVNAAALMQHLKAKKTRIRDTPHNTHANKLKLWETIAHDYAPLLWCVTLAVSLY